MDTNNKTIISDERIKRIEEFLKSTNLNSNTIKIIKEKDSYIKIINEALTHTSINYPFNHEKLEFLGDAVLRLVASEYIEEHYPKLKVGDRSALRSQLVSDEWLAKVGAKLNIKDVMLISPKTLNDEAAIKTIEAEGLEALLGAIYKCVNDINLIKSWLSKYWDLTSQEVLSDPHRLNSKSALQEWSQSQNISRPTYQIKELTKKHGDEKRFFCKVVINHNLLGEGYGSSRKNAEKAAAKVALDKINNT